MEASKSRGSRLGRGFMCVCVTETELEQGQDRRKQDGLTEF